MKLLPLSLIVSLFTPSSQHPNPTVETRMTSAIASGVTKTFWQISDIHLDAYYVPKGGDPNNWCHFAQDPAKRRNLGVFGDFYCDAPWRLVVSALRAMKRLEPAPSFIVWTGDSSAHFRVPRPPTMEYVYATERSIVKAMREEFPETLVLPALGNHDSSPIDFFPGKIKLGINHETFQYF